MSPTLLRREAALAGVALLGAILALGFGRGDDDSSTPAASAVPAAGTTWQAATASPYGKKRIGQSTSCGVRLTAAIEGIAHPVLPCGARLLVRAHGRQAEAVVVDRGPHVAGDDFDLTPALALALGV